MRFYPNSGKPIYKAIFVAFICAMLSNRAVLAQTIYQPYTYQFYQKFSDQLYNSGTNLHTAIKPYFIEDTLLKRSYDSMMQIGSKNNFFNEHLFNKSGNGYELYSDVLPDVQIGNGTWVTSLGYQVGGNIGKKFSFYGSIYENRARFPNYLENIINSTYYIPGEGKDQDPGQPVKSWLYSSFLLSYSLTKFVNFTLGKDKTFIGDGYRSMLLSDAASNYPFFKTTVTLGNVKYMTMYAYLDDPNAPKVPGSAATRTKWGYFQYIDWNVSKKVSIGFFENVMAVSQDSIGRKRGFDFTLASPFVIMQPSVNAENDPDKNLIGFTAKYKIFAKTTLYGQFALDEFRAKDFFSSDGSWTNKYGIQLGIRGADLFNIKHLNYLAEYNSARPYTYTSFDQTSNYSQDDQSLANPFGANFREWLGIINYSAGRFDFQVHFEYAFYGLDTNGLDYGQNISRPYTEVVYKFGNYIGQGLRTNFYYNEEKIAYILNPKYNLQVELSALFRDEKNTQFNFKTNLFTIGLRSSFRQIYNDISSFKSH